MLSRVKIYCCYFKFVNLNVNLDKSWCEPNLIWGFSNNRQIMLKFDMSMYGIVKMWHFLNKKVSISISDDKNINNNNENYLKILITGCLMLCVIVQEIILSLSHSLEPLYHILKRYVSWSDLCLWLITADIIYLLSMATHCFSYKVHWILFICEGVYSLFWICAAFSDPYLFYCVVWTLPALALDLYDYTSI